jgi:hypothetical protein
VDRGMEMKELVSGDLANPVNGYSTFQAFSDLFNSGG